MMPRMTWKVLQAYHPGRQGLENSGNRLNRTMCINIHNKCEHCHVIRGNSFTQ